MNKIKWGAWNPSTGKDEEGNYYLRVGHWLTVVMAYVKIIIALLVIIGY